MEGAIADHLRPLDSSFLHVEDGVTHMHIGACAIFAGPPPDDADVVALIAAKLPDSASTVSASGWCRLSSGGRVWVDDSRFDLAYHVRHTAVPPPGGEEGLRRLMGELMEVELTANDPCGGYGWSMASRTRVGTDLQGPPLHGRWDLRHGPAGEAARHRPGPTPLAPPEAWRPESEPSGAALVVAALTDLLHPRPSAGRASDVVSSAPCRRRRARLVGGAMALRRDLRPASALSIEGAIGRHRRWAVARRGLEELRAVRAVLGGTINDVVLAVITGAFRELLLARGDRPEDTVLRSLVPVSVRPTGDHTANNQVAAMIVELPVHVADPANGSSPSGTR